MKIQDSKAAVDKEWEKLETLSVRQMTNAKSRKGRLFWKHKKGEELFPCCYAGGHLSSQTELEPKYHKCKGRLVLRDDIVKDDSGSSAVFTEQGSSASQMTAAKVIDVISRLPGCTEQAADAVSACTQVKMEDAPKLLKSAKSECPDTWIRLPRHKWPKS